MRYVLYNKCCGHVVGMSATRETLRRQADALSLTTNWGWRIRLSADGDDDALLKGVRCETCSLDGQVVKS
jgi:hypothetical protein